MKQRLVGTIVLGSLALIGIPLLLDGEGVETPPLSLAMPPAPQINTAPIPEPQRPSFAIGAVAEPSPTVGTESGAGTISTGTPEPAVLPGAAVSETTLPAAVSTETVQVDSAVATLAAAPAARSETVPARDAEGLPEAWTVRLGAFSARANAEALVSRLLGAGHKAYLQPVTTTQGSMSGVFVGPVLTRSEAEQLRQQLVAAGFSEEGLVQQFRIAP